MNMIPVNQFVIPYMRDIKYKILFGPNQSYTALAMALFKKMCGYLPESQYNIKTRQIVDDNYPRVIQWCSTEEQPIDLVNIDISKCYPSILLNNNTQIPIYMYTVHD